MMMDFGMVGGMDSLMVGGGGDGNGNGNGPNGGLGSVGFLKQERTSCAEDDWRGFKMARTSSSTTTTTPSLLRSNSVLFSDGAQSQQQMLSFSSSPTTTDPPLTLPLPYYHHPHPHPHHHALSAAYSRNAGLGPGSLNTTSMHGGLPGVRGPFTPSQWMELEHQALIYKYINANVPIPSNLLIPIRKALNPSGFAAFGGSLRHNALGWGSFHLGFSGNNDPEPGRCRRTDGKKWRCSRDAVADQKYCERHMNRGRHRSRKPVEGQTGHAASGPATTKVMPMVSSSSASVVSGGSGSNSLAITQHQVKRVQTSVNDANMNSHINRMLLQKENVEGRVQDAQSLSMVSPTMNLKSNDSPFSVLKSDLTFAESRTDFGLISSDSLLNTSQRSSYIDCRNFNSSPDLNEHESRPQDPLRHFIDDWPKNRSDSSSLTWPEVEETQLDCTQLSISIPVASSDFSSSSSSPAHEKLTLSPLRLSREFNPIHMGLGVGSVLSNEPTQRQANWIPISWETSMGGPLGEVLNKTNNAGPDCKNSSALNLMTEGWDVNSHMELSPTGVLQKAAFGSLSNSSTGSSPRAETNKIRDGGSLRDNLLGSTLVSSSSIPTL
ncbi:hypothetical protein Sjap_022622 [Stephania japonica]|uniref:Growth-regulating factor n=1 Tax=Stephania japonica TaxID=461633 RepID=A0AAP0HV51_9MAGN